jgi:hypothetical protein
MDLVGAGNLRVSAVRLERLAQKFLRRTTCSLNSGLYVLLIAVELVLFGGKYNRYDSTSS